jgi:GxxExxY protein
VTVVGVTIEWRWGLDLSFVLSRMHTATTSLLHGAITGSIIDSFHAVYNALGFGHREFIYSLAMERDLTAKGHNAVREFSVMVYYQGLPLARESIDMVVDDLVVVENKSAERLRPADYEQPRCYLCCTFFEVALLLHFGPRPTFHQTIFENRLKLHGNEVPRAPR